MRDIKFRALFKHILTSKTLWYDIVVNYSLKNIEGYVQVSPWLQYTGLKDKEGKEIYDGDVVKYEVYNLNEKSHFYNGEIQWWQGQLGTGWRYKSKNTTFMLKTFNVFKMEKIGNKYDNPELLKQ